MKLILFNLTEFFSEEIFEKKNEKKPELSTPKNSLDKIWKS